MIDGVIEEARRLMKENPSMKFYEALIEAKRVLKEKEPIAASKIGSKVNSFYFFYCSTVEVRKSN